MITEPTTRRQQELLSIIVDYANKHKDYPRSTHLQKRLQLDASGISNLARELKRKGYIHNQPGRYIPTDEAIEHMRELHYTVSMPCYVRVVGQVKAGSAGPNDLRIDPYDIADPDAPTIAIPSDDVEQGLVAYQVLGDSMTAYDIPEGSYIVVRSLSSNQSNHGFAASAKRQTPFIVARYLAEKDESILYDVGEVPFDLLHGPTVKYYLGQDQNGYHILKGRRSTGDDITIRTRYIETIGTVIGVFKSFL